MRYHHVDTSKVILDERGVPYRRPRETVFSPFNVFRVARGMWPRFA